MNIWNGWTVTVPSGVGDAAATLPGSPAAGRRPLRDSTGPGPGCRAALTASRASSVVSTPSGERRVRVVGRRGEVDLHRAVRRDREPAAGEQLVALVDAVEQHRARVGVVGVFLSALVGVGVVV